MAQIMDGRKLSERLAQKMQGKFDPTLQLAAVLVGDNPASRLYVEKKEEMAKRLGAGFKLYYLSAEATTTQVCELLHNLNADPHVGGIMLQLPLLPGMPVDYVVNIIDPAKDVDGLTDTNISSSRILPATARGILELLKAYKITLKGKRVGLVGFTRLLNIPLAIHLQQLGNEVFVLQKGTRDYPRLAEADVIVTATGVPGLITAKMVKKGAVVIDAGIARKGGKVRGDVDFMPVAERAGYITPTPGGVGPMTVVSLYQNFQDVLRLARLAK